VTVAAVEELQGISLLAATITVGLMAGVFALYSLAIMPGLRRTDDRTFVGAFQQIDTAIINPLFLAMFFGGLVLTALAAALHLGDDTDSVFPWILAALLLYLAVIVITLRINVPLNDAIKAAGDPDRIADLAAVRERFDEARWARWNLVRAVATTASLGCLAWALAEYGNAVLS
jgi:uncharacterized membrane protein